MQQISNIYRTKTFSAAFRNNDQYIQYNYTYIHILYILLHVTCYTWNITVKILKLIMLLKHSSNYFKNLKFKKLNSNYYKHFL